MDLVLFITIIFFLIGMVTCFYMLLTWFNGRTTMKQYLVPIAIVIVDALLMISIPNFI